LVRKIIKIVAAIYWVSDFKDKMHQIQFRLGLKLLKELAYSTPKTPSWI